MDKKIQNGSKDLNTSKDLKNKQTTAHKIGDVIEHAGDRLSEKGAGKLGKVVHDAGDKIEHLQDK